MTLRRQRKTQVVSVSHQLFLAEGLFVDRPLEQVDLLPFERLAARPENPIPLNRYNYRDSFVFCHACGRHNHYKGITIELDSGELALIGNCCAEEFFGKNAYDRIEKELKKKEDYVYYKSAIEPIRTVIDSALSAINSLEHLCRNLDQTKQSFRREFHELYLELVDRIRNWGGRLTVTVEQQNYSHVESGRGKRTQFVDKVLGHVRGAEFIILSAEITRRLHRLRAELDLVAAKLAKNPDTTSELADIHRSVYTTCRRSAVELFLLLDHGCDFFSPRNLDAIGVWADQLRVETLKERGYSQNEIRPAKPYAQKISEIVPAGFQKPGRQLIEVLTKKA